MTRSQTIAAAVIVIVVILLAVLFFWSGGPEKTESLSEDGEAGIVSQEEATEGTEAPAAAVE